MKKIVLFTMISFTVGMGVSYQVIAEEFEDIIEKSEKQIEELNRQKEQFNVEIEKTDKKIEEINNQKADNEFLLFELSEEIDELNEKIKKVNTEKKILELKINSLNVEIEELTEIVEKRGNQIDEQVRAAQITLDDQDILNVLLNAESLTDAINRTTAYTKLVSSNHKILREQKRDQQNLLFKTQELQKEIESVSEVTKELKSNQTDLEKKKAKQVEIAQEILDSLENEQQQKANFIALKEEAEKVAEENKQRLEETKRLKEEADKELERQIKKQQQEQKEREALEAQQKIELEANELSAKSKSFSENDSESFSLKDEDFKLPLNSGYVVTSTFGYRTDPTGYSGNFHDGIDLAVPTGTPIVASLSGKVVESGYHYSAGNYVIIQHPNGLYTYYMHMVTPGISKGSVVNTGDVIGKVGSTGASTGAHLHFGVSTKIWGGFLNPTSILVF